MGSGIGFGMTGGGDSNRGADVISGQCSASCAALRVRRSHPESTRSSPPAGSLSAVEEAGEGGGTDRLESGLRRLWGVFFPPALRRPLPLPLLVGVVCFFDSFGGVLRIAWLKCS